MHLFSPHRPEASPGTSALLNGVAVPPLIVNYRRPGGGVELSALLWCYDAHGGFVYHTATVPFADVGQVLHNFEIDPERVLHSLFNWEAKGPIGLTAKPEPKPTPKPNKMSSIDLL